MPGDTDRDELNDELETVKNFTSFALRSFRRHWRLILITIAVAAAASGLITRLLPEEYRVDTRLLTDPGYVMVGLTSPDRRIPATALDATRGAVELIRSRQAFEEVITEAKLPETWRAHRPPIRIAIDEVRELVGDPLTPQELREAMVELMETRLWASVDAGVVSITARWHDPLIATRIAHAAQQRFIRLQQEREVSEIQETIGILEKAIEDSRPTLDLAANKMRVLARKHQARIVRRGPAMPPVGVHPMVARLDLKRNELQAAEQGYMELVRESRSNLSRLTTQLGPLHPDVLDARRTLENLSQPPPQIDELRQEVQTFESKLSGEAAASYSDLQVVTAGGGIDPELEQAVQAYRYHEGNYRDLLDRLGNARMEMETARSGFAHRFIVTQPAVPPREPTSPGAILVVLLGVFGGVLLGLGLAVLKDLRSGRLMEAWQVSAELDVPLLAEIDDP